MVTYIIITTKNISKSSANEINYFAQNLENYNTKLQVFNSDNLIKASFNVAIANNNNLKTKGLMFVKFLPDSHGMLFTYQKPQIVNMWMKNTYINLDMLFIDKDNKIINITENAEKLSLDIISSQQEVTNVLEINSGLVKKLALQVGDYIKIIN